MKDKKIVSIVLRYLLAIASILALPLFYIIFRPLTIYPLYYKASLLYGAFLQGNVLTVNSHSIEIIDACIAGSAYLLLLIINLTTPLTLKKRIFSILVSFFLLLVFNLARLMVLIILLVNNSLLFDISHKLFWYFISTIFVVLIWLLIIKIFRIRAIPVYSDIKFILKYLKTNLRKE